MAGADICRVSPDLNLTIKAMNIVKARKREEIGVHIG